MTPGHLGRWTAGSTPLFRVWAEAGVLGRSKGEGGRGGMCGRVRAWDEAAVGVLLYCEVMSFSLSVSMCLCYVMLSLCIV